MQPLAVRLCTCGILLAAASRGTFAESLYFPGSHAPGRGPGISSMAKVAARPSHGLCLRALRGGADTAIAGQPQVFSAHSLTRGMETSRCTCTCG